MTNTNQINFNNIYKKKKGIKKMSKLYYIKCDDFICDVTNRFDHAQDLLKEYQKDDPTSNYKIQYSQGSTEIVKTEFNKERLKQCLNIT